MDLDIERAVVLGIDFGTLSGRALVIRVADGIELGSVVHDYSHAMVDERLTVTGERLPPNWDLHVPPDQPIARNVAAITNCSPSTRSCTTTSVAGTTRSCTSCGARDARFTARAE